MEDRERERLLCAVFDADGRWIVRSPAVGWWTDAPGAGEIVGPGSRLGRLQCLHQGLQLVLGEGPVARVEDAPRDRRVAVEYAQRLLSLRPLGPEAQLVQPRTEGRVEGVGVDLPPGIRAIVAPTDGMFYRSPSPDAPPFVEPGSRIRVGQPVGLVEVMKTFHQILYGGADAPPEASVLEIRCRDGQEVQSGEILLLVR